MIYEICAIIATTVFMLLAYFAVRTLINIDRSLAHMRSISIDVECKLKDLNSVFKGAEQLGKICEEKSKELVEEENIRKKYSELVERNNNHHTDMPDLLLIGLKLVAKFLRR